MGGHVDCIVRVIALAFHHRDHHRTHRRNVSARRAGNAAEQRAGEHIAHAQAAAHMADQCACEVDDFVGYSAVQHEFASENKERNREE